ncbi:MAG: hypothetical protein Q9202_005799 [Teloschistes flavicans]
MASRGLSDARNYADQDLVHYDKWVTTLPVFSLRRVYPEQSGFSKIGESLYLQICEDVVRFMEDILSGLRWVAFVIEARDIVALGTAEALAQVLIASDRGAKDIQQLLNHRLQSPSYKLFLPWAQYFNSLGLPPRGLDDISIFRANRFIHRLEISRYELFKRITGERLGEVDYVDQDGEISRYPQRQDAYETEYREWRKAYKQSRIEAFKHVVEALDEDLSETDKELSASDQESSKTDDELSESDNPQPTADPQNRRLPNVLTRTLTATREGTSPILLHYPPFTIAPKTSSAPTPDTPDIQTNHPVAISQQVEAASPLPSDTEEDVDYEFTPEMFELAPEYPGEGATSMFLPVL